MRYWIDPVSAEVAEVGRTGGFTQGNHSQDSRLRQLGPGDWLVFCSPRPAADGGASELAFTAIGQVTGVEPYQVWESDDSRPWRLAVVFEEASAVSVQSLTGSLLDLGDLQQQRDPRLRQLVRATRADMERIAEAMGVKLDG